MADADDDKPKTETASAEPAPEIEPKEPDVMGAKPRPRAKKIRRPWGFWRVLWTATKLGFLIGVVIPVVLVAIYRFVPPPGTILMVQGALQGRGVNYHWRPLRQISPTLVSAAVASEDGKFCSHHGFDFDAIDKALEHNAKGRRIRGGSTISQQTAKNVFLWPQRSWVRKGAETWFTVLIETIWGKKRIMEVYLNVAEMGPGLYGAEAAARKYFNIDAAHLSAAQSARLITVLPNPIRYKVETPGRYVAKRTGRVAAAAGMVRRQGFAGCVLR